MKRIVAALGLGSFLALSACGQSEEPAGAGGDILGSELGSTVSDAAGRATDELATGLAARIDQQKSQLSSLEASAGTLGDEQLDRLIDTVDGKLEAASAKLAELKNADEGSIKALQQEIQRLLGEIGPLIQQAKDRVTQLTGGG